MEIVNATTGSPGNLDDEGEMQFGSSDPLSISFENKKGRFYLSLYAGEERWREDPLR
jgi:hypothetical protein